jgi:hypothetical protein
MDTIRDTTLSPDEATRAIAQVRPGEGGRFFPYVKNFSTTPHLWQQKQRALAVIRSEFDSIFPIITASVFSNVPLAWFVRPAPSGPAVRVRRAPSSSLRAATAARPSLLAPAQIADELLAQTRSARIAAQAINGMNLPQERAAQAMSAFYAGTNKTFGNLVRLPNGDLVLPSGTPGVARPINIITPKGQVSFGFADIGLTSSFSYTVTNVVSE